MKKINYLSKIFWSLSLGATFFIACVDNIFAEENESSEIKEKVVEENNDFTEHNSVETDTFTTDNPIDETIKNGWEFLNGNKYYYENGQLVKLDFKTIESSTYYFNEDDSAHIGWLDLNGKKYYFDINGVMQKNTFIEGIELDNNGIARLGWCKDAQGWKYIHNDGSYTKNNFEVVDNQTYYFDVNGYMQAGWQVIGNKKYYFNESSGIMLKNQWVGDSYLGNDGALISIKNNNSQWIQDSTGWWYRHEDGSYTANDFEVVNGQTYYFNVSGYMVTGWQLIEGKYYYFDASGAMARDTWIGDYYVDENGVWDTNRFKPQWILNSTGWWYRHEDGSYTTNDFEVINGQTYYFNAAGYMVTGWQLVDDTWYYFDGSGAMKTGWVYTGNIWYYLDTEGKMLTGFQDIAGQRYYFNGSGYMVTGWQLIEGKYYYFDASGAMARDTWIGDYYVDELGIWDTNRFKPQWILNSTGWWYQHEDGSYTTNDFEVINGQTYYFNAAGYMVTGWQLVDDTWYYFDGSGAMKTGWVYTGNIWYYLDTEGKMLTGFQDIAGQRYYFNDAGYMMTGWIQDGNDWYYASSSGAFSTGWQYIGNVWYYLDPNDNGLMLSDRKQSIDNTTYFFGQSGQMLTGWVNRPEGWYYAETSGAMHTGWLKLSSGKYYLDPNDSINPGIMVHDEERVIDGKTYKFLSDGRIYTGFVTKDEGTYLINEDGDIVKGWGLYQGYWYYFSPDGTEHPGIMLTNQWLNLSEGTYYLSSDGKMKTGWILDNGSWYYATERGSIVKNGFGTISAKDAGGVSRVSYFEADGKLRMYSFTIGKVNYTVDGSGYITNTTVNGVPYYNQRDPQWAWTVIGSGNMQNTACAVMVATSIVNYYTNLNVNPVDMGKLFYQNGVYNAGGLDGTSADCWEIVKNQYGLNYTNNLSYEDLINYLRMGKIVATSENPGHFTVPGFTHAILLYGIDANGYVNVYDPYDTSKNGKYHISMIWSQQSTAYEDCINGGPFFAF